MTNRDVSRRWSRNLLIVQFFWGLSVGMLTVQIVGLPSRVNYAAILLAILVSVLPLEAAKYFLESDIGYKIIRSWRNLSEHSIAIGNELVLERISTLSSPIETRQAKPSLSHRSLKAVLHHTRELHVSLERLTQEVGSLKGETTFIRDDLEAASHTATVIREELSRSRDELSAQLRRIEAILMVNRESEYILRRNMADALSLNVYPPNLTKANLLNYRSFHEMESTLLAKTTSVLRNLFTRDEPHLWMSAHLHARVPWQYHGLRQYEETFQSLRRAGLLAAERETTADVPLLMWAILRSLGR